MMEAPVAQYTIADIFAQFPWPRKQSEYFVEVKAESEAWVKLFHPFDEEGLKGLWKCDIGELHFNSLYLISQINYSVSSTPWITLVF
jgi:hypothetical protein